MQLGYALQAAAALMVNRNNITLSTSMKFPGMDSEQARAYILDQYRVPDGIFRHTFAE